MPFFDLKDSHACNHDKNTIAWTVQKYSKRKEKVNIPLDTLNNYLDLLGNSEVSFLFSLYVCRIFFIAFAGSQYP